MSTVNGYRLMRKSDNTEIARWSVIPLAILLPGGALFNVPSDYDGPQYFVESVQWTVDDPTPPTLEQLVDGMFPDAGVQKALFEALFEVANRLQALEGKTSITRSQLRTWLISKAS